MSVSLLPAVNLGNLVGAATAAPGSATRIYKISFAQSETFYATDGTGELSLVRDKNANNKVDPGETLATSSKGNLGFETLAAGTYFLLGGNRRKWYS